MFTRTPSKKTARRPTQVPESRPPAGSQPQQNAANSEFLGNKVKIGRLPKSALEQAMSAPGYSQEPVSESRPRKGNKLSGGAAKDGLPEASQVQAKGGQKPPKKKFNTQPMPSLRLGFAIKCKKDDLNQRYELLVESQLSNRVYIVRNTKTDRLCCMKIEPFDSSSELKQLKRDVFVLLDAVKNPHFGSKHFLPIVNKGVCQEYFNYLVMPMCEGTLAEIRENVVGGEFCPETAVRLTFDTFQAVTDLHGLGHVHRNISPSKFVVGPGAKGLYLIGLSFAIRIANPSQSSPRKLEHFGPNRHQSRIWHRNKQQLRRDDLESWLYMSIEFFGQKLLPWSADMSDMEVLVQKERMFNDGFDEIFGESGAPKQLGMLLKTLNSMAAQDKPDYEFIACSLVTIREKIQCELKGPYDWTSSKKRQLLQQQGALLGNSPHRKKKASRKVVAICVDGNEPDQSRQKEKKPAKSNAIIDEDEQNFLPQRKKKIVNQALATGVADEQEEEEPAKVKRKKKVISMEQHENEEDEPVPMQKKTKKPSGASAAAVAPAPIPEDGGEEEKPVQKPRKKKPIPVIQEEEEGDEEPVQKTSKKGKKPSATVTAVAAAPEDVEEEEPLPKPKKKKTPTQAPADGGEDQPAAAPVPKAPTPKNKPVVKPKASPQEEDGDDENEQPKKVKKQGSAEAHQPEQAKDPSPKAKTMEATEGENAQENPKEAQKEKEQAGQMSSGGNDSDKGDPAPAPAAADAPVVSMYAKPNV